MRLSRKISRHPSMRLGVVVLFVLCAAACSLLVALLGGSARAMVPVQLLIAASAVLAYLAPVDRMHVRWFHVLPVLIAVESVLAMFVVAPNGGPIAVIVAFNGPLVCFVGENRTQTRAHLTFSTVALLIPVLAGATSEQSTILVAGSIATMWVVGLSVGHVWRHAEVQAARLAQLAESDPLTGLANRRRLEEQLAYELTRHERSGRAFSVVMFDLNGFKQVNDELGHQAGDELLRAVATALAGAVRPTDTVARQGGDEFCILAPELEASAADTLMADVKATLSRISAGGRPLQTAAGRATFPQDGRSASTLLESADARQRADKPGGGRGALEVVR